MKTFSIIAALLVITTSAHADVALNSGNLAGKWGQEDIGAKDFPAPIFLPAI